MAESLNATDSGPAGSVPPPGKAIVLFSDGTGNSSAKLFKTNVWRMYEATDLGPPARNRRKQIAFYDNGVGTSALRPLAMLGGIFGFGLKRNVLEIYRYACRNYAPADGQGRGEEPPPGSDEIYGFGFSRGAFTMRVVAALIADQGLVRAKTERELLRLSEDAYRAYRSRFLPRKWSHPTRLLRWTYAKLSGAWRRARDIAPYDPDKNYRPIIRFLGVWDTVAAYGGPIAEITRGIDNWIYALSMPNYVLHPRVRCARHALAIDDERDAFHPLLWEEVAEAALRGKHPPETAPWLHHRNEDEARLQQVWFTGMHADVGGGYPDESLSYVSFLWMMREAEKAGLNLVKVVTDRHRALASSAGPIHDSRSGPGAYYRYQPRNIAAWIDPRAAGSIISDPEIRDEHGRPRGLLESVKVHESVLARVATGTDGYAPFTLPAEIRIVPVQRGDETAPQADSVAPEGPAAEEEDEPRPLLSPELRARLENPRLGAARAAAMATAWDQVWLRRVAYFTTLGLTLALLLMPWWIESVPDPLLLADGRNWLGGIIRMLALVTPDFLDPLIDGLADNAFYFLLLAALIWLSMSTGKWLERRLREKTRAVWDEVLTIDEPLPEGTRPGPVRRFLERATSDGQAGIDKVPADAAPSGPVHSLRTSRLYRGTMRVLKWRVLPALAALAIGALLLWVAAGTVVQMWLPFSEEDGTLCAYGRSDTPVAVNRIDFSPASTCQPLGHTVREGERYILEFDVIEAWRDGVHPADPAGLGAFDMGLAGIFGVPFRRVITARYLQPVATIRTERGDVYMQPLTLHRLGDGGASWRGEFEAGRSGALALFANDAALPWNPDLFYRVPEEEPGRDSAGKSATGNAGSACVTIRRSDLAGEPLPPDAPGPACAAADRCAAEAEARRDRQEEARRRRADAIKRGALGR